MDLIQEQSRNTYTSQNYDYFLVLDFEATCDQKPIDPIEIIEFPALKFDCKTFEIVDSFHQYVRPLIHPKLSNFCIDLTGNYKRNSIE
ncbi:hypothetical protein NH340_JMT02534 [Sarcoptes scabiei]|nr:hypothetical protein NH340_JMT02534 [Sarcoptes scabiei]